LKNSAAVDKCASTKECRLPAKLTKWLLLLLFKLYAYRLSGGVVPSFLPFPQGHPFPDHQVGYPSPLSLLQPHGSIQILELPFAGHKSCEASTDGLGPERGLTDAQ
jgi:hypothetical protein